MATNCEQAYRRYLRHGERLSVATKLDRVTGPKRTTLGVGWFITTRNRWYSGAELVADMLFRVFKYRPPAPGTDKHDAETGGEHQAQRPAHVVSSAAASGGDQLPTMTIEATPTFVISSALATRDFQDVHHDRDKAIAHGSKDIFVNILTDTGLVQRFVTDWAGPSARIHGISLRLKVPCYAYDTLTLTGRVTTVDGEHDTVSVTGRGQLGDHLLGTVRLTR